MNTHFACAVFLILYGQVTLATATELNAGSSPETSAAPAGVAQVDAQRRRADLRAALQAQHADGANQTARQLSSKDRAELRQLLHEQRRLSQHP